MEQIEERPRKEKQEERKRFEAGLEDGNVAKSSA
jgi:hypothetical protein